jgi:hypothetical protein
MNFSWDDCWYLLQYVKIIYVIPKTGLAQEKH